MMYSKYCIDSHVHITREMKNMFNMPEDMVIEAMNKYGIDFCLISNADGAECDSDKKIFLPEDQHNQVETLKNDIKFAKKYPGKIGILPWISPLLQGYSKEFEKVVRDNRDYIYGIKIHPYHNQTAPDSERIKPYLDLASELHLPVLSHTGGCEEASVEHIYNAAKRYPEIPFIMAHMDLGTDNSKAIEYIGKLDNLYGDTAWVPIKTTLEVIKKYGSHKIMFGSDMPIDGLDTYKYNKQGQPSLYREYFNDLHDIISKEDYENIMYKNACRIYGIDLK